MAIETSVPTLPLPGVDPVPKKRGRPPTGFAADNAARSKAKRDRLLADGKKQLSITLSLDVIDALKKHVEFKDGFTLGDAVDKVVRDRLMRKR